MKKSYFLLLLLIIISIVTVIGWFGYLLADVDILKPLIGNVLQVIVYLMLIKQIKLESKL